MHNCRETKEHITELLLDGADHPDEALSAELRGCAECRSEFDSLSATLRVTTRMKETATPAESYWLGYHDRLRQRIENLAGEFDAKAQRRKGERRSFFAPLRLCVKPAVRVPVPLMVLIALCLFGIVAIRQPTPESPLIVHVPVEVPVVKEKVVTRVVYRDRRVQARIAKQPTQTPNTESTFAKSQKPPAELPTTLIGFKPTEEVKLTVIKGGSQNEK